MSQYSDWEQGWDDTLTVWKHPKRCWMETASDTMSAQLDAIATDGCKADSTVDTPEDAT